LVPLWRSGTITIHDSMRNNIPILKSFVAALPVCHLACLPFCRHAVSPCCRVARGGEKSGETSGPLSTRTRRPRKSEIVRCRFAVLPCCLLAVLPCWEGRGRRRRGGLRLLRPAVAKPLSVPNRRTAIREPERPGGVSFRRERIRYAPPRDGRGTMPTVMTSEAAGPTLGGREGRGAIRGGREWYLPRKFARRHGLP
jgi:hypothetical protein